MSKSSPSPKKDRPEITVSRLLKNLRKNKSQKKNKEEPNRNLPAKPVRSGIVTEGELTGENYVSEEEAFGQTVQNEAYLTLARRYRWSRWGIVALLLIFLFFMFNLFKEEITLENFRYLMRNVNFELKAEIEDAGIISYDSDAQNTFALFKNSLAVANGQKLTIFDAGGRSSCSVEQNYTSPALKASSKYLIAYDRSGGAYSVYTSFSQMFSDSTGYPISDVDVTDDGIYAIASRSKEYFGVVTIYNSAFKPLNKIQKNKYIASIDLTDDGKSILIASYYSSEKGYTTELMTLKVDSNEPDLLFTVEDVMPYRVQWTGEDGSFLLCGSSGIKFFDSDGKIYNEYIFSGQNVIKYSVDASGAAIVTAADADATCSVLTLLDHTGKVTGSYTVDGQIQAVTLYGKNVCMISQDRAWKVEEGKLYRSQSGDRLQAMVFRDDLCWLCGYTRVLVPVWEAVQD